MAFRSTWSPSFDYLVRAGDQGVALGNNTLAAWVRFDDFNDPYEVIEINSTDGFFFGSAIILNGNEFEFSQRSSSDQVNFIAGGVLTANVWYHVAITYDGTTCRGYVNGVEVDNSTGLTGTRGNWSDIQVGPALGYLQDAFFYTRALSAAEILQLYARRMAPSLLNCRHWLPIFPGAGRTKDFSGNGWDFSASGTPTDPGSTIALPQRGWGGSRPRVFLPSADSVSFSGTSSSPSACGGTLAVRKLFGGVSTTPSAATGTLDVQDGLSFSGLANSPTAATGTLRVRKSASGTSATPTAATGTLRVRKSAAVSCVSPSSCGGTLRVQKFFSGVSASPTACQGTQSGGTITLPPNPEDPRNSQNRRMGNLRRRVRYG